MINKEKILEALKRKRYTVYSYLEGNPHIIYKWDFEKDFVSHEETRKFHEEISTKYGKISSFIYREVTKEDLPIRKSDHIINNRINIERLN